MTFGDHFLDAAKQVELLPLHMATQGVDVAQRISDHRFFRDETARNDRSNIVTELNAEFRNMPVVDGNAIKADGQIGPYSLQLGIDTIFLRMMHGIRVHGHVMHDVVQQFEVGVFAVEQAIRFQFQQVEQEAHVLVVLAKFCQYFGNVIFHGGQLVIGWQLRHHRIVWVSRESGLSPI